MVRLILAVVAGLVTWMIVVTGIDHLLRAVLPGYLAAEPTMRFTLGMMFARLAMAAVTSIVAGYVTAVVARDRMIAAYICGALVLAPFVYIHVTHWSLFPIWYHLFFLITLLPLVLCGALIHQRSNQPSVRFA